MGYQLAEFFELTSDRIWCCSEVANEITDLSLKLPQPAEVRATSAANCILVARVGVGQHGQVQFLDVVVMSLCCRRCRPILRDALRR